MAENPVESKKKKDSEKDTGPVVGTMVWNEGQVNGVEQIVPCPYISNDLVQLRELKPVQNVNEKTGEMILIPTNDKDDPDEPDDQVMGVYTSGRTGLEIPLKQFRWNLIGTDFTVVIYGKRRTGKTHFLMTLCWQLRPYFKKVVVFTKTKFNGDLAKIFPDSRIVEDPSPQLIAEVLKAQKKDLEEAKEKEVDGEDPENNRLLVILDDVLSSDDNGHHTYRYNNAIDKCFFNGRHYKICFVCTSQDSKGLPPNLKQNTDLAVIFPMNARRDRESIGDNCMPFLQNDQEIRDFLYKGFNWKHQFLAVVNCKSSIPLHQQVYTGIATAPHLVPKFVMGGYSSWKDDLQQLWDLGFHDYCHLYRDEDWGIQSTMPPQPPRYGMEERKIGMKYMPVDADDKFIEAVHPKKRRLGPSF